MDVSRQSKWIHFPPFFSFAGLFVLSLFSNGRESSSLSPLTWGVFLSIYLSLCALSAFLIISDNTRFNSGVFLTAQGMLFSLLGPSLGILAIEWLGFLSLLVGLFVSFYQITHGILEPPTKTFMSATETSDVDFASLCNSFPFPVCMADRNDQITSVNDAFCIAVAQEREVLVGRFTTEFCPADRDNTDFASGHWWIVRIPLEYKQLIVLSPTQDGLPPKVSPVQPAPELPVEPSFVDGETALYTEHYQSIRLPQELERAKRYRRSFSLALLTLEFSPPAEMPFSDQNRNMLFWAFARKVKDTLRSTDVAFLARDGRITILLPETNLSGAKTFMGRIVSIPEDLFDDDIRDLIHPRVKIGITFYNGTPPVEYDDLLRVLSDAYNAGDR